MKHLLITLVLTGSIFNSMAQLTPYEKHPGKNVTATYAETIAFYRQLAEKFDQLKMLTCGPTDIGKDLNLVVLSKERIFSADAARKSGKRILLINNGIHPGEPEGIDASMMLARDLLEKNKLPDDVVICIIPVYNIDGMLNRGTSRVNQNGPESYGFRGNSRNLDLNRDFIKSDSKNSRSFQQIFNEWLPEVFIDNHTSNGADYQYVMTLIHPQKDKLHPVLSAYAGSTLIPDLYRAMADAGFEMTPYVNSIEESPDAGIAGFLETARYSTGYAALHNTIGFMPETHMLKPYAQRVESTYQLMISMINIVQRDAVRIGANRKKADEETAAQKAFPLSWQLDKEKFSTIRFKGYEAKFRKSEVTGEQRLYYDRGSPYEKEIKIRDNYVVSAEVIKPAAYIIPQSWEQVVALLRLNGVKLKQLPEDAELEAEMYYIEDYKTVPRPFEGHYLHSQVKLRTVKQKVRFQAGDHIVITDQDKNRYIVETLEPQGVDSFFAWNFFDSVLGQKEHFSAYVFEDEAERMLKADTVLRSRFGAAKKADPELLKSPEAQLNWIYRNSPYYEKSFMRYPVGRLNDLKALDLK